MRFAYHQNSGDSVVVVKDELYRHIIKSRRHKIGDTINMRNLKDNTLYSYKIASINRSDATLELANSLVDSTTKQLKHIIAWCLVESKIIEDTLPMLNELGVDELVFVMCAYSQSNIKLSYERMERILINSSMQCGRADILKIKSPISFKDFLASYPNAYRIDFETSGTSDHIGNSIALIGPEGGFSQGGRELLLISKSLKIDNILKSQTAIVAAVAISNYTTNQI